MKEEEIKKISNNLKSSDVRIRQKTANDIAVAVEKGEDVSSLVPNLIEALSDTDQTVRSNIVWIFAYITEKGVDVSSAIPKLSKTISDSNEGIRQNSVWALACASKNGLDISSTILDIINALADISKNVVGNASYTLGLALENKTSSAKTLSLLKDALSTDKSIIATNIAKILTDYYVKNGFFEDVIPLISNNNASVRWGTIYGLSQLSDNGFSIEKLVPDIAKLLKDENPNIRTRTGYTLVSIVEHGGNIYPSLLELSEALLDDEESVKKETVWALYCLAFEGKDIEKSVDGLTKCLKDKSPSVRGNGAIALTLHYLNTGKKDLAENLFNSNDGNIKFGAVWATTDYYVKTKDEAKFTELILSVPPGIGEQSLRKGIIGSLNWARETGKDISFALSIINKLISKTNDPLKQASLYGILMGLQRKFD